jgi:hypothetical protein
VSQASILLPLSALRAPSSKLNEVGLHIDAPGLVQQTVGVERRFVVHAATLHLVCDGVVSFSDGVNGNEAVTYVPTDRFPALQAPDEHVVLHMLTKKVLSAQRFRINVPLSHVVIASPADTAHRGGVGGLASRFSEG